MNRLEFNYQSVPARKGLLNFLEEQGEENILRRIGENTKAWLEELDLITYLVTDKSLVCVTGFSPPSIENPDFQKIGDNAYFYDGKDNRLEGLWTKKDFDKETAKLVGENCEWSKYRTKLNASLKINKNFANIPPEEFLPENFEQKGERLKDAKKRPIWKVKIGGREIYAKGSEIVISKYYNYARPSYRLTSFSSIHKVTSKREMKITEILANLGVNVPTILGYYESSFEDFLFVDEIKGKQPQEFLDTHRQEIIRQDAEMLANLCRAGYRKGYFEDFDDKIFDGERLWLIDVDECSNLYSLTNINFRQTLLDPTEKSSLRKFRRLQKSVFNGVLRDSIYTYRNTLTPTNQDKENYVKTFYQKLGWKIPCAKKMRDFLTFSKNYQTTESHMSMMMDTD